MTDGAPALDLAAFDPVQTGFFRFRRLAGKYLITNDFGRFRLLSDGDFARFVSGALDKGSALYGGLVKDGFIRDHLDFEGLAAVWRRRHRALWQGARTHVVFPTLRGLPGVSARDAAREMCLDTAKRVVRRVFESPSPSILLELDGAEPLANWPVVKLLVEGARKAAVDGGRELRVRLVSDLSLLNLDKLDFLISNAVDFRVPLHGPEDLHDEARASVGGAAHAKTLRWLRAIREKAEGKASRVEATVSASRLSLGRHAEIVDAHARAGLGAVSVRRAGPFEVAPASRAAAVLSPEEYLDFYRGFLDSVLAANARAVFVEETARAFLTRILTDAEPGSERLRSPSGEGLGLLAYDVDGAIYACEEGAILGRAGDDSFRIGSVREGTASDAAAHPAVKALAVASLLENQPDCARCAYNPYHGVSPAQCYAEQGDIFGRMPTNARCRIDKGILDLLFERLQDAANEAVFRGWLTPQNVGGSFRKEVL